MQSGARRGADDRRPIINFYSIKPNHLKSHESLLCPWMLWSLWFYLLPIDEHNHKFLVSKYPFRCSHPFSVILHQWITDLRAFWRRAIKLLKNRHVICNASCVERFKPVCRRPTFPIYIDSILINAMLMSERSTHSHISIDTRSAIDSAGPSSI